MKQKHIDKLSNLFDSANKICKNNKTNDCLKSWNLHNNPNYDSGFLPPPNSLCFYFLIYLNSKMGFQYKDVNDNHIQIEYDDFYKQYRIDVENTRYAQHRFWRFNHSDFDNVENYVLLLIKSHYNFITTDFELLNLTDECGTVEGLKTLYAKVNMKTRKEKLDKINTSIR